jgi:hypothetical protein
VKYPTMMTRSIMCRHHPLLSHPLALHMKTPPHIGIQQLRIRRVFPVDSLCHYHNLHDITTPRPGWLTGLLHGKFGPNML